MSSISTPPAVRRIAVFVVLSFPILSPLDAIPVVSAQTTATAPIDPLKSAVPDVRRRAATDLGKSKRKEALPRLAELVRDPDMEVRLAVLRAIASLRDLAGVPSMVVFMSDEQSKVRLDAIDGVVEIYTHRDRPGVSRFLSIFSDGRDKPEPLVVSAVDFEVYRSLAACLRDSDPNVRESAAEAIGILGGTEVAVDLVAALGDTTPKVRAAAVSALAKVGTSADGEALVRVLKDPNGDVRRRAIAGLGRLRVMDSAPELRRLFGGAPDSDDGILALGSLAQLAQSEDLALFRRLAKQQDPRRRRISVEGLARLRDAASADSLKRAFQRERDDELRAAYAFAIFLLGDRPFIDTVVLGFGGSRDRARQARSYVEELGARSLPEALDYLREPDAKIRAGLCDALSNAGVVDAVSAIEPLQKDGDAQVRASAARAVALLTRQKR